MLFLVLLFLWCEVPVNAEGQTEISAWVEAPKDPDRPDNPNGTGSEGGRGDSVETGDRNTILTLIILLLLSGILITAEGIRRNDG